MNMSKLPFETWDYEEQTRVKHYVFADYIDKWIKILGKYNKLNYIDGFGGIGAYKDKEENLYYGSPILVCQTIEKIVSKSSRDVNILVIDADKKNLNNIQKILNYLKIKIKPVMIDKDFDDTINNIISQVKNIAPTFVFVDPFGFSIKMQTLQKIMAIDKSEILLNFMFTRINQFLSASHVEQVYNDLFGGSDWQIFKSFKGIKREEGIIEHYRKKLKEFSKFVYYYKLEFPSKRKTYYYLFHLTNHYKGCAIMKSSFAKFNLGRVEYRGARAGQLELFEQDSVKQNDIIDMLCSKYSCKKLSFRGIIEENIDSTEYLESQLRSALRLLELQNKIKIKRIPNTTLTRRTRVSITENDIITFLR
jgi:three-Cys-motif partner protein